MNIDVKNLPETEVSCSNCQACCCRLEVILISDTGVPERFIGLNDSNMHVMARLNDGWCSALDRDSMTCSIYANRPLVCREFEMGSTDCITERATFR